MASISPHIPADLLKGNTVDQGSAVEQPEAGPSLGPQIPGRTGSATIITPLPLPRYEEEEEDEDDYAPQLPPDLAAARAIAAGTQRRPTSGPARGPLPREEEEESEDEIGPAPPPLHAGAGQSDAREDAITDFMQKEAQRRQAVEVRLSTHASFTSSPPVFHRWHACAPMCSFPPTYFTGGCTSQNASA
jgi:hypothetical protein